MHQNLPKNVSNFFLSFFVRAAFQIGAINFRVCFFVLSNVFFVFKKTVHQQHPHKMNRFQMLSNYKFFVHTFLRA